MWETAIIREVLKTNVKEAAIRIAALRRQDRVRAELAHVKQRAILCESMFVSKTVLLKNIWAYDYQKDYMLGFSSRFV